MAEKTYLAVDLGAESGRVMAGRFDGKHVSLHEIHRFGNGPIRLGGTLRWNLVGLWTEIQNGLREAASRYGSSISSIGVDTWGVDFVLMNRNDEMLGQAWNYRDSRTDGMLAKALQRVPRAEIFSQTGLQFMQINSLYQLLAMCERDPELVSQATRFLMIPDFFNWCLCGSRVVEFTNATTTQMLNATTRTWADDILRRLDIPTQMFPEIVNPGAQLGGLRKDVSEFTGLNKVNVVAPATHDTGSAVAAVPTSHTGNPDWAYISSGTWSLMGVEVNNAVLSEKALQRNVTNEGGIGGTYRLLKNIMGLWLVQECRRTWEREGRELGYDELVRLAAEAEPFHALVDPDCVDFILPPHMPKAFAGFCARTGQEAPEGPGPVVRCALESLAFKYRLVLETLERVSGTRAEVLHVVGGGGKNRLLCQFTADACGIPVVAGPVEATAIGNLLTQAMGIGAIGSLAEAREVVRRSFEVETFEPRESGRWTEHYQRFQALVGR